MKSTLRKVRRCALITLVFTVKLCLLPLVITIDLLLSLITAFLVWTGHAYGATYMTRKDFGEYFTREIPSYIRYTFSDFRESFKEALQ